MPKRGPDKKKLKKITSIMKSIGSKGIWVRELARQTNLPVATVHLYLNKFLEHQVKIETVKIGKLNHSQMKIVKLKPSRDKNERSSFV